MATILLIKDSNAPSITLQSMPQDLKTLLTTTSSIADGHTTLQKGTYDIVLLEVCLNKATITEHIPQIMNHRGHPDVIVISTTQCRETVENSLRLGAWDFLTTPLSPMSLTTCLSRCLSHRKARQQFVSDSVFHRGPILGNSSKLLRAIQEIGAVAKTNNNVLLSGETGTGKELFARAVHENSPRKDNSFTVIDCTNLPPSLAQSILFGHSKGTFTDAKECHEGLFKQADGGTVFLDEIADLDLEIQKSLLRVLQEHKFRPLSSRSEIYSNFRLVAATNKDLLTLVKNGAFREDLFFRLKSCSIPLPPLRERVQDITILTTHYLDKIFTENKLPRKKISNDFRKALNSYQWPGNVRELINALNYAVSNSYDTKTIHLHHLPIELRINYTTINLEQPSTLSRRSNVHSTLKLDGATECRAVINSMDNLVTFKETRKKVVTSMEGKYLQNLLKTTKGSLQKSCSISGLSQARLYDLLRKYKIPYKQYQRD